MRYLCYRLYKGTVNDDYCFTLVQQLGGWTSMRIDSIDFFVPENRAGILLLSNQGFQRREQDDYIG